MADQSMERATSFGTVADHYDRFRPAPPPAAVDWLLPDGAERVADIAAGTGAFTRVLATRVDQVVAVELDMRMVRLLAVRSDAALAVCGRAEELPVRASSFDAVTVSSAWHWLDPDRVLPEIARVLSPGGVLGVVWNGPGRHVSWVSELLGHGQETPAEPRRTPRQVTIPDGQPFSKPEFRVIDWSLPRSPEELVALAGTYSRVITMERSERQAVARRAAEYVESHPLLRDRPEIDLPMRVVCWRCIRTDAGP